ncbi:uncharacterized protein P884DRAFT_273212 [Thermothelomyces heterothallicus CBS 202.75]|uniref:uncharacterized protein n=1 Tax=Thermothelomyces heterothallicus CBS 202.75 TaxID=1149848 RepID=UPI00374403A1
MEHPENSPVYPISPLLLERLQRSRQLENGRVSSHSSTDMLSSSGSRRVRRSPSPTDSHRPGSDGGVDAVKAKKGLGIKEMEQTLSTLHKQNFDLKLELYHRRERQAALEARVDTLEREAKERDELNESLLRELEKRDKAVEEAIGMILALEKRVEELLLERKMVFQVEAEKPPYSRVASPLVTPSSQSKTSELATPGDSSKTPIRMPSFVSDRSENTENLRSVYMAGLACESGVSLPRLAEDTPDTACIDPRLASPALSELSESSFASVYGRGRTVDLPSTPGNRPDQRDVPSRTAAPGVESPTRAGTSTPKGHRRPSSSRVASGQFHTISGIMAVTPSPPQRTEGPKPTHATPRDFLKPPTGKKEQPPITRPPTSHSQPKSKKEKREALERVITQAQFTNPQTLPPTPDTLSTTTLPNNETPVKDHGPDSEHNRRDLTEANITKIPEQLEHVSPSRAAQPASTTAFDSRKHCHATGGSSVAAAVAPDQRSSPSTTDSAYARALNGNSWNGDAPRYTARYRRDSTTSSIDTWLRESLKPESTEGLGPMSSVSQVHPNATSGRVSPDLFSFPTSAHGWMANTMLGSLGGKDHAGPQAKNASVTPIADMLDAIEASRPTPPIMSCRRKTPINGAAAPSPPNRQSSLLARTGAPADTKPGMEGIPQPPPHPSPSASSKVNSPVRGSHTRRNSNHVRSVDHHPTELGLKQGRAMTVPPKQVHAPPPPIHHHHHQHQQQPDAPIKQDPPMQALSKQRHYPPPSQTSRPRSRGLTAFFRRSTGSADVPAPPASAPPTQTAFKPPPPRSWSRQRAGSGSEALPAALGMGMPSWVRRGSLADGERPSGATPPPILRKKKGPSQPSFMDGSGVDARAVGLGDDEDGDGGAVLEPSPAAAGMPGGGGGGGGAPVGIPPPSGKSSSSSRKSWGGSTGGVVENGEGGGVSLGGGGGNSGNSGSGKRKWLGLGRVSSLRNRGGT